jgi:hypothetical protein
VVQIGFARLGRIFLHITPCSTVYSISVPSRPHPVPESSSQITCSPGEDINDDGGRGSAGRNLASC